MPDEAVSDEELRANRVEVSKRIKDLVKDLLYYDRKGDWDLPCGRIEMLLDRGMLSPEDIVKEFEAAVFLALK